jgi:hypothetical protein
MQRFNVGVSMLALSLDNLLFFLLIAVAALFQLLSKALSKAGKSDSNKTSSSPKQQTRRPIPRAARESDADRIRKFLEALGQPPSSTPPSPVLPRTDIPPRPLAPVQPPPVIPGVWRSPRERRQKPEATQRESRPAEQRSRLQEIVPSLIPAPTSAAFDVHDTLQVELQQPSIIETPVEIVAAGTPSLAKGPDFKTDIVTLLASKSGLPKAILLREIFGTPRGLQELDATL